jgi:hypothetical protein
MQFILAAAFLSLDANDWVALGTWTLVVATVLLWIVALRTFKEQRRITILLQRPIITVINPILTPLGTEKSLLVFNIENTGHSIASDLTLTVNYKIDNYPSDQKTNITIGHLQAQDSFGVTVPIPIPYPKLQSNQIPFSFAAEFRYGDIEKEKNSYLYAAEYNYKLNIFTINKRAFT